MTEPRLKKQFHFYNILFQLTINNCTVIQLITNYVSYSSADEISFNVVVGVPGDTLSLGGVGGWVGGCKGCFCCCYLSWPLRSRGDGDADGDVICAAVCSLFRFVAVAAVVVAAAAVPEQSPAAAAAAVAVFAVSAPALCGSTQEQQRHRRRPRPRRSYRRHY